MPMWSNERIGELLPLRSPDRFACRGHLWDFVVLLDQVVPGWYDAIQSRGNSEHYLTREQARVDIPRQFGHLRLWQDRTGLELVENDRALVPAPRQAHVLEDEDVYDDEDVNEDDDDDDD
jgi:hypothetical protein